MTEMNRRTFVVTLGAACLAAHRLGAASIQRVGVQLYTVRDLMAKDFEGTLAQVAALGYKEVEFAGYFKRTPEQVRDILKKTGLSSPSTHIDFATLRDKPEAAIEASNTIGHQFIVLPWLDEKVRKEPDVYKRVADTLNRAGELGQKAGIKLAYHNHQFEFVPADGKLPFDTLLETCDPKLVAIEMDLCWMAVAKKDPLEYFKRYPGRFSLVHVKGLRQAGAAGPEADTKAVLAEITDVGGPGDTIDWKRIFAQSNQAGIKHYFVEHDVPKAPLESLKTSYDYVSKLQF